MDNVVRSRISLAFVVTCSSVTRVVRLHNEHPHVRVKAIASQRRFLVGLSFFVLAPLTMSHRRRSSTASYAPVLINPTPHSPSQPTSHSTPPSTPRITYPYPLTFLALVDLAYTVYQSRQSSIPTHLIVLSALRCGVLTLVLGLNKRWRNRGGWVAIISTFTLGAVVWEVCDAELRKDKEGESTTTLHVVFLGTVRLASSLVHTCR